MWSITIILIIILLLCYVNKVELTNQNMYLLLIAILFIVTIQGSYEQKVQIEGLDVAGVDPVALGNMASMFRNGEARFNNLTLLGDLKVGGNSTLDSGMKVNGKSLLTGGADVYGQLTAVNGNVVVGGENENTTITPKIVRVISHAGSENEASCAMGPTHVTVASESKTGQLMNNKLVMTDGDKIANVNASTISATTLSADNVSADNVSARYLKALSGIKKGNKQVVFRGDKIGLAAPKFSKYLNVCYGGDDLKCINGDYKKYAKGGNDQWATWSKTPAILKIE
jgi:hypothetical protein